MQKPIDKTLVERAIKTMEIIVEKVASDGDFLQCRMALGYLKEILTVLSAEYFVEHEYKMYCLNAVIALLHSCRDLRRNDKPKHAGVVFRLTSRLFFADALWDDAVLLQQEDA